MSYKHVALGLSIWRILWSVDPLKNTHFWWSSQTQKPDCYWPKLTRPSFTLTARHFVCSYPSHDRASYKLSKQVLLGLCVHKCCVAVCVRVFFHDSVSRMLTGCHKYSLYITYARGLLDLLFTELLVTHLLKMCLFITLLFSKHSFVQQNHDLRTFDDGDDTKGKTSFTPQFKRSTSKTRRRVC